MAELSPTQKLEKSGVVVRKKLNSSKDINETQLLNMVQTETDYGTSIEYINLTPLVWSGNDTLTLRFNRRT